MFKLESYITPILLSQVERYVKNIKAEDSQVSLWGGDAVFNNLDLRLDVLEEELRLPFSLVSGHIHELQIHVPWTRLNAEPIVLTINTIECVLKLPSDRASSESGEGSVESNVSESGVKSERKRDKRKKDEQGAPPGYIQSLVNKIISNIKIVCNNLILKYVEDDLVLSLNVRNVTHVSCDHTWTPAFTELSLPDLMLRKLVSVSDLTICLDRRGTTGKIDVYQDPLLYRCSMEARFCWSYQSVSSKTPIKTTINLLADKMEFSMTGLQVPMVVRLFKLFLAFYYGDIVTKHELQRRKSEGAADDGTEGEHNHESDDQGASLGSLIWDVGSTLGTALLPVYWEDEDAPTPPPSLPNNLSSLLGVYIKEATLTLKLAANVKQKGFYRGGKQCFNSYLQTKLFGIFSEVNTIGQNWVNVQAGISRVSVTPVGTPSETIPHYLHLGAQSDKFLGKSLFAPDFGSEDATDAREMNLTRDPDWDRHVDSVTESVLLERSSAFAMDYVYNIDIPGDIASEDLSELGQDLEHSNLAERALCRVVIGPVSLHVTEGAMTRLKTLQDLIRDYDYVPYVEPAQPPSPDNLTLPTKEEIDNLENNCPTRVFRVLMMHPSVTLQLGQSSVELGLGSLDLVHQVPMYPLRNVKAGCLMHPPSVSILNNCRSTSSISLLDAWVKINLETDSARVFTLDKLTLSLKSLFYRSFWKNIYQALGESSLHLETMQVDVSVPQILLLQEIANLFSHSKINPNIKEIVQKSNNKSHSIFSILISNFSSGVTWTQEILTSKISIDALSASLKGRGKATPIPFFTGICVKTNRNLTLSCPGVSPGKALLDQSSSHFLSVTFQFPYKNPTHPVPTMVDFNVGQSFFLVDQKLFELVQLLLTHCDKKSSDLKVIESKRSLRSEEIVSVKDSPIQNLTTMSIIGQCLSGTLINIKLGEINFYICDKSLSNVSGQTVSEIIVKAARSRKEQHILNLQLSSISVQNANCKVDLSTYTQFPVLFPPTIWSPGKLNLPWDLAFTGFCVSRMMETSRLEILPAVTTKCTLGSSSGDLTRSLAIHVDMSHVQIFLTSDIVTCLALVTQTLVSTALDMLSKPNADQGSKLRIQTTPTQPRGLVQRSLGSVSESTTQVTSVFSQHSNKTENASDWSVWLQWAIPLCQISLQSNIGQKQKLNILFEDTSVSVDKQSTYTKTKFRIRSITGEHLKADKDDENEIYKPKNFPNHVITCQPDALKTLYVYNPETGVVDVLSDDDEIDVNHLTKGVFNLTITQAQCQNMFKKIKKPKERLLSLDSKRYLTELDFEINPIDVFLENSILELFLSIFYPLASIKVPKKENNASTNSVGDTLSQLNNNNLPMLYVKSDRIRVFILSDKQQDDLIPDFILYQMKKASINSQVDNPLSRVLVEPGLYHQAASSKLLSIPGSPVEDRQYQGRVETIIYSDE